MVLLLLLPFSMFSSSSKHKISIACMCEVKCVQTEHKLSQDEVNSNVVACEALRRHVKYKFA